MRMTPSRSGYPAVRETSAWLAVNCGGCGEAVTQEFPIRRTSTAGLCCSLLILAESIASKKRPKPRIWLKHIVAYVSTVQPWTTANNKHCPPHVKQQNWSESVSSGRRFSTLQIMKTEHTKLQRGVGIRQYSCFGRGVRASTGQEFGLGVAQAMTQASELTCLRMKLNDLRQATDVVNYSSKLAFSLIKWRI